jgi:hypothetical protein
MKHLTNALVAVDWSGHIAAFCSDQVAAQKVTSGNLRLAVWAKQFETIEKGNPALTFIREMQSAGHLVASTTALALYKSAAGSCRTILESALYYTYFRTHPSELATLVRQDKWYVSKSYIIEYHGTHTAEFAELQKHCPVVQPLNSWYSKISAIVHGQIPGAWHPQRSIADTKPNVGLQSEVVDNFCECVGIVNNLFLCTVGRELWGHFSTTAKKEIVHGMSGASKAALGLDLA